MADQHPITPPRELVKEWIAEIWHEGTPVQVAQSDLHLADRATQWGADQELEACCEWLSTKSITDSLCNYSLQFIADDLRNARRPKPSTQAEKALNHFELFSATFDVFGGDSDLIRHALKRLKQLEESND